MACQNVLWIIDPLPYTVKTSATEIELLESQ